jgi:hypothetical protein
MKVLGGVYTFLGHSILRVTIPVGTVLYHGQPDRTFPSREWLAFDPEFSFVYTNGVEDGFLYTYVSTRQLNLVYFDGASANKVDGTADSQDILFLGKLREPLDEHDPPRIHEGCDWGKEYDIDGFVRMEFNL